MSEFQLNRAYIPGISTAHDRRSFNFSFYQRINNAKKATYKNTICDLFVFQTVDVCNLLAFYVRYRELDILGYCNYDSL